MESLITTLKQFGLTEYEAKVYVALVTQSPAAASDVSKRSTVPRARVYGTLDGLAEKGLVLKEQAEKTAVYRALPVELFMEKAQQDFEKNANNVERALKELAQKPQEQPAQVMSLQERETILQYCRYLLANAKDTVFLSMWDDMYELLRVDIEEASKHVHVKGVTIHAQNVLPTIDIHRTTNYTETTKNPHWFIMTIDHQQAIYGSPVTERLSAFLTDDPMHVYILEDYIWHDVLVNRLVKKTHDEMLDDWVREERASFFKA